jgi:hypothetical protein
MLGKVRRAWARVRKPASFPTKSRSRLFRPPPTADPLKLALGERLFTDPCLSANGALTPRHRAVSADARRYLGKRTTGISDVLRWPIVAEEIAVALAYSSALTRLGAMPQRSAASLCTTN